jgi:hypothetical protein
MWLTSSRGSLVSWRFRPAREPVCVDINHRIMCLICRATECVGQEYDVCPSVRRADLLPTLSGNTNYLELRGRNCRLWVRKHRRP